jgi:hypothetical protein
MGRQDYNSYFVASRGESDHKIWRLAAFTVGDDLALAIPGVFDLVRMHDARASLRLVVFKARVKNQVGEPWHLVEASEPMSLTSVSQRDTLYVKCRPRSYAVTDTAFSAERTSIDFLIAADYAEVINNKVYLMGGGWDQFAPQRYPAPMKIGIAVGIRVPYLESNVRHHLVLRLRTGDGLELFKLEADLETGRPPGSRGASMLVPLAVNSQVQLLQPADLELVADVDGSSRYITIRAIERPQGPQVHIVGGDPPQQAES